MNKQKIESFPSSLAVFLLLTLSLGFIVFFGDQIFSWDIFPPGIEKVLAFIMGTGLILIISSVMVNIMINLSIIATGTNVLLTKHLRIDPEPKTTGPVHKPLIASGLVLVGVIGFLFALSTIDKHRKQAVTLVYASELATYTDQNRANLTTLFTEIFPNELCYPSQTNICPKPQTERIASLLPNNLKDFSSTFFVKKGVGGRILLMYLSGEVAEFHIYDPAQKTKVEQLLDGNLDFLPWDEYFSSFPKKEVIVPFRDQNGRVAGAIIRGVIEQ